MENVLVSVIIPVYNTGKYIKDCLNSVLHQSHKNLEVIIINDGSTDSSAQECRQFVSDSRVVFVDRENWGLSKTRQQGIDMARGEYFCNLDSDDALDKDFVQKMLRSAIVNGADVVACGRKDFDLEYEREFNLCSSKDVYLLDKEIISKDFDVISKELWLADSWNKMYRTEFVRKTGVKYWLNNRFNGTDLSFNHLIFLHCPKVSVVNEPLLLHRIVQGSRVHRKNKPLLEGFHLIAERQLNEANNLRYGSAFLQRYMHVYYTFLKMSMYAIISESENTKELRALRSNYWKMVNEFLSKHPELSLEYIKRAPGRGFDRIMHKAIISHRFFPCVRAYWLNKLRLWRIQKRSVQ